MRFLSVPPTILSGFPQQVKNLDKPRTNSDPECHITAVKVDLRIQHQYVRFLIRPLRRVI